MNEVGVGGDVYELGVGATVCTVVGDDVNDVGVGDDVNEVGVGATVCTVVGDDVNEVGVGGDVYEVGVGDDVTSSVGAADTVGANVIGVVDNDDVDTDSRTDKPISIATLCKVEVKFPSSTAAVSWFDSAS